MIALPLELKALITFLVTQGVKSVAKLFGKDVGGTGAVVVATAVGAVVFFIEGILALVPADKVELYNTALAFLAMVFATFGTHYTYKNIGANKPA